MAAKFHVLRDQLVARLKEIGDSPDYQRLAADVLGVRGAPPSSEEGMRAARASRFSWLSGRGSDATRLDPHDVLSPRELRVRLTALLQDERLFAERLDQRATCRTPSSSRAARVVPSKFRPT